MKIYLGERHQTSNNKRQQQQEGLRDSKVEREPSLNSINSSESSETTPMIAAKAGKAVLTGVWDDTGSIVSWRPPCNFVVQIVQDHGDA